MPERHRLTQTSPLEEERLAEEARRLRKQAQGTPPGIDRERLVRRARQAETGSHIFEWLNSRGSQPPKLAMAVTARTPPAACSLTVITGKLPWPPVAERSTFVLPPNVTQERAMHCKRSIPHTFRELLSAEKARLEAQLENTSQQEQRELIERRLRQIETVSRMDRWMASAELQPPR